MPVASSAVLPFPVSSSTLKSITCVLHPRPAIPRPSFVAAAIKPVTKVPWPFSSSAEAQRGLSSLHTSWPTTTLPTSWGCSGSTPVSRTATSTLGLPVVTPQASGALTAWRLVWPPGVLDRRTRPTTRVLDHHRPPGVGAAVDLGRPAGGAEARVVGHQSRFRRRVDRAAQARHSRPPAHLTVPTRRRRLQPRAGRSTNDGRGAAGGRDLAVPPTKKRGPFRHPGSAAAQAVLFARCKALQQPGRGSQKRPTPPKHRPQRANGAQHANPGRWRTAQRS